MITYIFIYNVVPIKSDLSDLIDRQDSRIILLGSDYCLKHLSKENKQFFHKIYRITRNFHQIDLDEVELILLDLLQQHGRDIRLFSNEDSTQLVCAHLREKYDIPGCNTEQVLPYVNKVISKSKLKGKVNIPRYISFNKIEYQRHPKEYISTVIDQIGHSS